MKTKIENAIKDKSIEMLDQPKGQFRTETIEGLIKNTTEEIIEHKIKEILGYPQGEIKIETIDDFKMNKIEKFITDIIKRTVKKMYPVTFRAHWKSYTMPKFETDLLVYLYNGLRGEKKASIDFENRIEQLDKYNFSTSNPVYLKKGTEISIKPEMPGFRFEPSQSSIILSEDWHRTEFRMQPLLKGRFPKLGKKIYGNVKLSVGPIPIGEINISIIIKDHLPEDEKNIKNEEMGSAYQKIFASYVREDLEVVEKIEKAFDAFGDEYMFDLRTFRSGQNWKSEILELIPKADVFHLFWSKASKASKYVKMEWQEALRVARKRREKNFIRPVYWKQPMPKPPYKLKDITFKYKNL